MKTIHELLDDLKNKKTTSVELVQTIIEEFEKDQKSELPLNALLEVYNDVTKVATQCDAERAEAEKNGTLADLLAQKPHNTVIMPGKHNRNDIVKLIPQDFWVKYSDYTFSFLDDVRMIKIDTI